MMVSAPGRRHGSVNAALPFRWDIPEALETQNPHDLHGCANLADLLIHGFVMQTKEAYGRALEALRKAGVELVSMDMHVLTELSDRIMPDESLYTYEMPRELSR